MALKFTITFLLVLTYIQIQYCMHDCVWIILPEGVIWVFTEFLLNNEKILKLLIELKGIHYWLYFSILMQVDFSPLLSMHWVFIVQSESEGHFSRPGSHRISYPQSPICSFRQFSFLPFIFICLVFRHILKILIFFTIQINTSASAFLLG